MSHKQKMQIQENRGALSQFARRQGLYFLTPDALNLQRDSGVAC